MVYEMMSSTSLFINLTDKSSTSFDFHLCFCKEIKANPIHVSFNLI